MKKPPKKVAYLSRNSVVSEIFHLLPNDCPTAQMAEFMFQNVVYRATVYRTRAVVVFVTSQTLLFILALAIPNLKLKEYKLGS